MLGRSSQFLSNSTRAPLPSQHTRTTTHALTHSRTRTRTHTHTHTNNDAHTPTHTQRLTRSHTQTTTHSLTHTHTRTHTQTTTRTRPLQVNTHAHTPSEVLGRAPDTHRSDRRLGRVGGATGESEACSCGRAPTAGCRRSSSEVEAVV